MHLIGEMGLALVAGLALVPAPARAQGKPDLKEAKEYQELLRKAVAYYNQENHRAAAEHLEKLLPLARRLAGPEHQATGAVMYLLGSTYAKDSRDAQAEPLLRRCVEILEARLDKDHPRVADALNALAVVYHHLGRYARAEALHLRCLRIQEAKRGKDHPDVALSLNNLAQVYQDMGRYDKAEQLYRRSLRIREAKRGKDHPDVAQTLNNLGGLYTDLGLYGKAEPLFLRSLQIREALLDRRPRDLASTLNNLALLYWKTNQHGKAEPLFRRSLQILEGCLGKDHLAVAQCVNNLGTLYREMKRYDQAEPLLRRGLAAMEAQLGKDHPALVSILNNLATLYLARGQYERAEPLLLRSLKLHETYLGPGHPEATIMLNNLVTQCVSQERWAEADRFMDRSRRSVRRHVATALPILSESDQLTLLRNTDKVSFDQAQSLGLLRQDDPAAVALAAGWVLNGKAVTHETLAERVLLARDSKDPRVAQVARELTGVRRQLAAASLADVKPGKQAERRRELEQLTAREQELSGKLGQAAGRPVRGDPWVELKEVRNALPANAVFIEISRFTFMSFLAGKVEADKKGDRYGAWLIPAAGRGAVEFVDLGEAGPIDRAVREVRQCLVEDRCYVV
jgi:tetratricopeptide (TPR) repeat protein